MTTVINESGPNGGGRDWASLEGLRRFIAARFVLSPHRAVSGVKAAPMSARAQAFSSDLIRKHEPFSLTGAHGFIRSLFGRATGELPGYRSGLIYREPGKTLHQSFYTWFVESVFSLAVHKLEQRFGVWLSLPYSTRALPNVEHEYVLVGHEHGQAAGRLVLTHRPATEADAGRRSGAAPFVVGRSSPTAYAVDVRPGVRGFKPPTPQTLQPSLQTLQLLTATRLVDAAPPSTLTLVDFRHSTGAHLIDTLRVLESRVRDVARIGFRVGATSTHRDPAASRAFAAPRRNVAGVSAALSRPRGTAESLTRLRDTTEKLTRLRDTTEKLREVYASGPRGGSDAAERKTAAEIGVVVTNAFASSTPGTNSGAATWTAVPLQSVFSMRPVTRDVTREMRRGVTRESAGRRPVYGRDFSRPNVVRGGAANWFEQRRAAHLSFVKAESTRVSTTTILLGAAGVAAQGDACEDAPAPMLNRELAARNVLSARTARAYEPASEGSREGANGLTFLRREEQFKPPPQSYAFATTPRRAPPEETSVMHVRSKEVTEVVRKEVETAMKSRSPFDSLSRADYSRIADHVYSSLTRRLVIDRERRGLQR